MRIIPWVNIIILTFLAFLLFMIRRMWLQFRERTIDPAIEDMGDAIDAMGDRAARSAQGSTRKLGPVQGLAVEPGRQVIGPAPAPTGDASGGEILARMTVRGGGSGLPPVRRS